MSPQTHYPQIDLAGTPREMGLAHGRLLRERIHRTLEVLRGILGTEAYDASWDDLQATCAYCEENAGDLVEEMRGIAEGAGVGFRDVFNISAHLELLVWKRLVRDARERLGAEACSSHAVVTEADVLLGWNGDDRRDWIECGAVVRGRPAGPPPFIYWSLAGSVGRPGMGPSLALGANTLPSRRWRPDGLLYPMLCRRILACRNVEEAVAVFERYNSCCGMNYLVADEAGTLVSIEAHADGFALVYPEDSGMRKVLLHTNCNLDPGLTGREPGEEPGCPRLAAARRLYHETPPSEAGGVRSIQADHTGGICVHRDDVCTVVSFVAETRAGRLHLTTGNPCEESPLTYALA